MTDRQRLDVGVHLRGEHFRPEMRSGTLSDGEPWASVEIIDGLRFNTIEPEVFYSLASVLIAAAHTIEDARALAALAADKTAAESANLAHRVRNREPFGTPVQHIAVTAPEVDGTDAEAVA